MPRERDTRLDRREAAGSVVGVPLSERWRGLREAPGDAHRRVAMLGQSLPGDARATADRRGLVAAGLAHATLRCVGIGNCRKTKNGVMCPSYMVTMEEKHSTRGRAHLLWDMLQGDAH